MRGLGAGRTSAASMHRAAQPRAPRWLVVAAIAWLGSQAGCGRDGTASTAPSARPGPGAPATHNPVEPGEPPFPTRLPAPRRLVAVGDLHGNLAAARAVLRVAGVVDTDDHWSGADAVLVQTGDVLDRGNDERAVHELLERLGPEAQAAGGAVHLLNGNHELLNVAGDFRYVAPRGFTDFVGADEQAERDPALGSLPLLERGRAAAFRPGGTWALRLAEQPLVLIVGDTLFTHGSLLPAHVTHGLERLNQQSRAWLQGRSAKGRGVVAGRDSPVWLRTFGGTEGPLGGPDATDCALLTRTLELAQATRMVVGHTIQKTEPTSACSGKVWRIDVGMGSVPTAVPRAIEISAGTVRVLGPEQPAVVEPDRPASAASSMPRAGSSSPERAASSPRPTRPVEAAAPAD